MALGHDEMSITDIVYNILTEEVNRLAFKQQEGALDIEDIRKIELLTRTAGNVGKAAPNAKNPAEEFDADELVQLLATTKPSPKEK